MRFTLPPFPGYRRRRSHLASFVLATLTVLGLLAMHGLSWGHDSGCRTAPTASSVHASSHTDLTVNGSDQASMLGMAPSSTVYSQKAASRTTTSVADSSMTRIADHLHAAVPEPQTFVPALAPAVPAPGSAGSTVMCVAVLAGLAVLALLLALRLAASRRATSRSRSHGLTGSSGTARRWPPPWAHLAPRLSVLCVSRT